VSLKVDLLGSKDMVSSVNLAFLPIRAPWQT
jgi:hypothetical protein